MITRDDLPDTPDWSLPERLAERGAVLMPIAGDDLAIPANIILATE